MLKRVSKQHNCDCVASVSRSLRGTWVSHNSSHSFIRLCSLLEVSWYDPERTERGSLLLRNSRKILASLLFFCASNVRQTLMRFKVRIKAFNSRTSEQHKEPNKHHQSSWYIYVPV